MELPGTKQGLAVDYSGCDNVLYLLVPLKMGNFLVNWATIILSKILLYGVTFDGKQNGVNKTPTATTNKSNPS